MRRLRTITVATATLVTGGCAGDASDPPRSSAPILTTTTPAATTPATTSTSIPGGAATQRDLDEVSVRLTPVASLESPIALAGRSDSPDLYVAERSGTVRLLRRTGDRFEVANQPVLDISTLANDLSGERGLLGLAFSPTGDRLFVNYSDGNDDGATVIDRYAMSGDTADPASRREVLRVAQPFANHNGGHLAFGPDGYLYIGLGDGGSQDDPDDRSQDPADLLGKMLRIDVVSDAGGAAYGIPADNPFVGTTTAPEIWSLGLRNPWRYSFDRLTGDLWIADVGGSEREEVNRSESPDPGRGLNFGWSLREGTRATGKPSDGEDLADPVYEYTHDRGSSITGGYVYRGAAIPDLAGAYLYSDFSDSTLRALTLTADGRVDQAVDLRTEGTVSQAVSFGQDHDGELYLVSLAGEVYRIDPT